MSGSGKSVPSKEFADLEANMNNCDLFVNSKEDTFKNRESDNGNDNSYTITGIKNLALSEIVKSTFITPSAPYGDGEIVPLGSEDPLNKKYAPNQSISYENPLTGGTIVYVLKSELSLPYDLSQPFNSDDWIPVSIRQYSKNYEPEGYSKYQKTFNITDKITGDPINFASIDVYHKGSRLRPVADDIVNADYSVVGNQVTLVSDLVDPDEGSLYFVLYIEDQITPDPIESGGDQVIYSLRSKGLNDGDTFTQAMLDSISNYSVISLAGLKNIKFEAGIDFANTNVVEVRFDGGWAWQEGSVTKTVKVGENRGFKFDIGSGAFYGDATIVILAAEVLPNATTMTFVDILDLEVGDHLACNLDNYNMPNSLSYVRPLCTITAINGNTVTLSHPILTQGVGVDFPLPEGLPIHQGNFQKDGIQYQGTGKLEISGGTWNNRTTKNWAGYIWTVRDPMGLASFSVRDADYSYSILDNMLLQLGGSIEIKRCKNLMTVDTGKQNASLDVAKDTLIKMHDNHFARSNKDAEFLYYKQGAPEGAGDMHGGRYDLKNNIIDGGYYWDDEFGIPPGTYGRNGYELGVNSFHVINPFKGVNLISGRVHSESNVYANFDRSVVGTTNIAKDAFKFDTLYFEGDRMDCDPVYRSVIGETILDHRAWECTLVNCLVYAKQFAFNYGVSTTCYNTELICTEEARIEQGGVIRMYMCQMHSGKLIGRFNPRGEYNEMDGVWLPYRNNDQANTPLFSGYNAEKVTNFILEVPDDYDSGLLDYNWWFASDTDNDRPGTPPFKAKLENAEVPITLGGQWLDNGYLVEMRCDNANSPPHDLTGKWFNTIPRQSTIYSPSDQVMRGIARRNTSVTSLGNGGSGLPSDTPFPKSEYRIMSAYDVATNKTRFFRKDQVATIDFTINAGDEVQFLSLTSKSAHHEELRLIDSESFYEIETQDSGSVLMALSSGQKFRVNDEAANGTTVTVCPGVGTGGNIVLSPDSTVFIYNISGASTPTGDITINNAAKLIKSSQIISGRQVWLYKLGG